ncbi:hypothetical protein IKO18_00310 [bacterium]|jgi:hypothetical protein|nr:hypothetical protein [bacterium]
MKKVQFKVSINSRVDERDGKEVLLEVEYNDNDSAYIEAIRQSYYHIHAPKNYRIIEPKIISNLVSIDRSTNEHDKLVISRIGFGTGHHVDRIRVEVVNITKE